MLVCSLTVVVWDAPRGKMPKEREVVVRGVYSARSRSPWMFEMGHLDWGSEWGRCLKRFLVCHRRHFSDSPCSTHRYRQRAPGIFGCGWWASLSQGSFVRCRAVSSHGMSLSFSFPNFRWLCPRRWPNKKTIRRFIKGEDSVREESPSSLQTV